MKAKMKPLVPDYYMGIDKVLNKEIDCETDTLNKYFNECVEVKGQDIINAGADKEAFRPESVYLFVNREDFKSYELVS